MKIAIVDDRITEQKKLGGYITSWALDKDLPVELFTYGSGESFLSVIESISFDIVFMDIIMDGKNGIETARRLREISLSVLLIFITSSPEYMAQAFPCHAFDYVMKPFSAERIINVLDDAVRALGKHVEVIEIGSDKFILSDILYVYSDSNYCEIYTKTAQSKVRISFTELTNRLERYRPFFVVGRGVIVNFENTSHISGFDCVMTNGEKIPVSRRKLQETERAFYDWQFGKMLSKE